MLPASGCTNPKNEDNGVEAYGLVVMKSLIWRFKVCATRINFATGYRLKVCLAIPTQYDQVISLIHYGLAIHDVYWMNGIGCMTNDK